MLGIDGPLSDETREAAVALMVEFCASSRTVQASLNMEFREITNGRNMLAEAVATLQDEGNGPNEKMPASRDIQSGGVLDGVTSLNRRLPHSDIDREEEIKRMIKDTQTIRDETALFEKKTREVQMKLAAEQAKKESLAQLEQRERELTAQLEELSHIPEEVQASVPKKVSAS